MVSKDKRELVSGHKPPELWQEHEPRSLEEKLVVEDLRGSVMGVFFFFLSQSASDYFFPPIVVKYTKFISSAQLSGAGYKK